MQKLSLSVLFLASSIGIGSAQTFEVASVKVAASLEPQKVLSGQQRVGMKVAGRNVDIESVSLPELLNLAFKVRMTQVKGPDWVVKVDALTALGGTRFDIHAKLPDGGSKDQVPEMLQALLVERFKLAFHRESQERDVYALVVGKNGPKLEPSPPDDPPSSPGESVRPDPIQVSGTPQTGMTIRGSGGAGAIRMQMGADGMMRLTADKATTEQLAGTVERFVGRPVIDRTGLTGTFKMSIDLSMAEIMAAARGAGANVPAGFAGPAPSTADLAANSIFQNIEKMGLKLESRKAPVELLVIDHLEKTPTED